MKKKSINILTFFGFSLSVMCYVLSVLCYVGHSAPSSPRRQPLLHLDCKIAFVLHKDQGSRISLNVHHLCRNGHQPLLRPFESSFAFYFWRRESRRGEADQVFVQRLGNFFLSKLWLRGRIPIRGIFVQPPSWGKVNPPDTSICCFSLQNVIKAKSREKEMKMKG